MVPPYNGITTGSWNLVYERQTSLLSPILTREDEDST